MLFDSSQFLLFFILVLFLFFSIAHQYRWILLLLTSIFFYASYIPLYTLILVLIVIIDFFAGLYIEKNIGKKRKIFLCVSISANILILVFFKYFNFLAENINQVLNFVNNGNSIPLLHIILPIGLSFHTFQAMSYTIEVYKGNQTAERNIGYYALYVFYFPQLVAGPIERPQNLIHQFKENFVFDEKKVLSGFQMVLWGLVKKMVIADRLGFIVNQIYGNLQNFAGIPLIIGTLCFSIQIYCDFSGYSDIAVGISRILGIDLMQNFNTPYFSKNIQDFWRRWHISLTTWFRDYVYVPMGGSKDKFQRQHFINILIIFLLSGLWHGAKWSFVVWGALNGLFYFMFSVLNNKRLLPQLPVWIMIPFTFLLVSFLWIFFRANSLNEAMYVVQNLFSSSSSVYHGSELKGLQTLNIFKEKGILVGLAIALQLFIVEWLFKVKRLYQFSSFPSYLKIGCYYILIAEIFFLKAPFGQQFIYFQF